VEATRIEPIARAHLLKRPAAPACSRFSQRQTGPHLATGSINPRVGPTVLLERDWHTRRSAHEQRVRAWTDPHQARVARGEKHPVYDFLFTYYAFRPAWLRRWQPGPDLMLTGESSREFLRRPEYREITLEDGTTAIAIDPVTLPAHRGEFLTWLRSLLAAMQTRPAFFGCHGLHEWAMVYRQTPDEVRHNAYPLRFTPTDLARIVETSPVTCSHFDAFRFFRGPPPPPA